MVIFMPACRSFSVGGEPGASGTIGRQLQVYTELAEVLRSGVCSLFGFVASVLSKGFACLLAGSHSLPTGRQIVRTDHYWAILPRRCLLPTRPCSVMKIVQGLAASKDDLVPETPSHRSYCMLFGEIVGGRHRLGSVIVLNSTIVLPILYHQRVESDTFHLGSI